MDRAYESIIDSQGHLDLPDPVRSRHGLHTGSKVMIEDRESEIIIKMPALSPELDRMKEAIQKSVGLLGTDKSMFDSYLEEKKVERNREDHDLHPR